MDTAIHAKASLVFLGPLTTAIPESERSVTYQDWDALLRSGVKPQGIYLKAAPHQAWHHWLDRIRQSDCWNLPVFADPAQSDAQLYVDALCSVERAREIAEGMALRRQTLPAPGDVVGLEERLLYFLYERGQQAGFKPLLDRDSDQLYRYPVAELLAYAQENVSLTLEDLRRRGLLRSEGLVDRTRHCSSCGSAHIHFVDVCPHCQSLDIRRESTLHCFACGHVGAESQFVESGSLACPKCHVHLRHIGVDYDKPLAQYHCRSCQRSSVETMVQARCLDCAHTGQPDELEVREVATLMLSASGRQAVRNGGVGEAFAPLRASNYVDPQGFRRMLEWASRIQARHSEFSFHLMRMELEHIDRPGQPVSPWQVTALLDEFAVRLNALLRESDLITRVDEHSLWAILPYTVPKGLQDRIEKALEKLTEEEGEVRRLAVRMRSMEVRAVNGGQEAPSASQLMQQMQSGALQEA